MYHLKTKQKGPKCSFCRTNKATQRTKYFTHYSCNDCLPQAIEVEQDNAERESQLTEADYQTWSKP